MANPVVVLDDTLTDIADAIRSKTGGTADMTPSEMPTQIASIPSGGSSLGNMREIDANGVYRMPTQNFTFSLPSVVTDVGDSALYHVLSECKTLTSVDLGSLATVTGSNAFTYAFRSCSNLTSVNFNSLTTIIGEYAFYFTFQTCSNLTSVSFPSLTTVSGRAGFFYSFQSCTNLTSASFPVLTTISGSSGFAYTFQNCPKLSNVNFNSLSTITGSSAFNYAFRSTSLKQLSFPRLSNVGTNTDQFNGMLADVTGCTVHFPASMQSTIGNWTSVQNGFGGTNTTVLFDL